MNITIFGAGAWGTALAINAAVQAGNSLSASAHGITLWARDAALLEDMRTSSFSTSFSANAKTNNRFNARYLPGVSLPSNLRLAGGAQSALEAATGQDLLIIATPMAALRAMLASLADVKVPVAWLSKGFEAASQGPDGMQAGLLGHELLQSVAPGLMAGVLSGPSFAQEVARCQPTALVAASTHAAVRDALVAAFHSPSLRVYASSDVVGVEVGGAVKNVMAIATGLCDGLGLGANARAALVTRGLVEMTRLAVALGGHAETLTGLSGLGDLVLTATGDLSRNRQVGLALAHGQTLAQAVAALGHVAEGVYSARTVVQRAQSLGVDMPIASAVLALLDGHITAPDALAMLMRREPTSEAEF